MSKFLVLMLFALNLVYFNQAMAFSSCNIEQTMIFNEEGSSGSDKNGGDEEKSPEEEDCE